MPECDVVGQIRTSVFRCYTLNTEVCFLIILPKAQTAGVCSGTSDCSLIKKI